MSRLFVLDAELLRFARNLLTRLLISRSGAMLLNVAVIATTCYSDLAETRYSRRMVINLSVRNRFDIRLLGGVLYCFYKIWLGLPVLSKWLA